MEMNLKTKLALAAVAFYASSAIAAEHTISGNFDVGIANVTDNGTYMQQGDLADHSKIVFSGSDDLGGGLTAFYRLSAGFDQNGGSANGGNVSANGTLFSRESKVGISGAFGTFTFGQQLSPYILSGVLVNQLVGQFYVNRLIMAGGLGAAAVGCTSCSTLGLAGAGGTRAQVGGFFIPNSIQYQTPAISGFKVTALVGMDNGSNDGALVLPGAEDPNDSYTSIAIDGAVEGINIHAATQSRKDMYSTYVIGTKVPVGEAFSITANYMNHEDEGLDSIGSYAFGGRYEMGGGISLVAQYANADYADSQTLTNFAVLYALSKSTTVYFTTTRGTNGANPTLADRARWSPSGDSKTATSIGINHAW
tara:strand:+ start:275 stop:1366 length:1092 start_codon:yes stop_codon:yes gene_type:complete